MNDKLFSKFLTTYEQQYSKIKNYQFTVRLNKNDEAMMDNFITDLLIRLNQSNIGNDFISSYVESQFAYWLSLDTKLGAKTIPLNWVFGKKALDRWFQTSYSANKFKTKIKLKNVGIKSIKSKNKEDLNTSKNILLKTFVELSEVEEAMKSKALNKEYGFLNCVQTTTMFNHKSPNCLVCDFQIKCKAFLSTNYKTINKARGYE